MKPHDPAFNALHGLTCREYIATQALVGILASFMGVELPTRTADMAVEYADALIAQLSKPKETS